MSKDWKEMATDEKLDALRKDVAVAFAHINRIESRLDLMSESISSNLHNLLRAQEETNSTLKAVAADVAALKKKEGKS